MADLQRFREAQNHRFAGFEVALAELRAGRKRSHWIWYVFPQLAGLGRSSAATRYAIADLAEAEAYLRDDVLRARLLAATEAIARQLDRPSPPRLEELMGADIDALKLISSLTLFGEFAHRLNATEPHAELARLRELADQILAVAERQGYRPCEFTREKLGRSTGLGVG